MVLSDIVAFFRWGYRLAEASTESASAEGMGKTFVTHYTLLQDQGRRYGAALLRPGLGQHRLKAAAQAGRGARRGPDPRRDEAADPRFAEGLRVEEVVSIAALAAILDELSA